MDPIFRKMNIHNILYKYSDSYCGLLKLPQGAELQTFKKKMYVLHPYF